MTKVDFSEKLGIPHFFTRFELPGSLMDIALFEEEVLKQLQIDLINKAMLREFLLFELKSILSLFLISMFFKESAYQENNLSLNNSYLQNYTKFVTMYVVWKSLYDFIISTQGKQRDDFVLEILIFLSKSIDPEFIKDPKISIEIPISEENDSNDPTELKLKISFFEMLKRFLIFLKSCSYEEKDGRLYITVTVEQ